MMEITTARLAIIGPRKGQIFIFEADERAKKGLS